MSLTVFEVYCSLYKLQFQKLHTNVRSCPNLQHFVQVMWTVHCYLSQPATSWQVLCLATSLMEVKLAGIVPGHFTYGGQLDDSWFVQVTSSPQPPPITIDQDTLMTATCCMIHCISFSLFPAENQVASKFAFLLAAGFGMEFLCEDCCLYRVRFPVSGCLWLPINPKSCVPLHCLCKANKLGKRPWQLPSPFCAYSFGSTLLISSYSSRAHCFCF